MSVTSPDDFQSEELHSSMQVGQLHTVDLNQFITDQVQILLKQLMSGVQNNAAPIVAPNMANTFWFDTPPKVVHDREASSRSHSASVYLQMNIFLLGRGIRSKLQHLFHLMLTTIRRFSQCIMGLTIL